MDLATFSLWVILTAGVYWPAIRLGRLNGSARWRHDNCILPPPGRSTNNVPRRETLFFWAMFGVFGSMAVYVALGSEAEGGAKIAMVLTLLAAPVVEGITSFCVCDKLNQSIGARR